MGGCDKQRAVWSNTSSPSTTHTHTDVLLYLPPPTATTKGARVTATVATGAVATAVTSVTEQHLRNLFSLTNYCDGARDQVTTPSSLTSEPGTVSPPANQPLLLSSIRKPLAVGLLWPPSRTLQFKVFKFLIDNHIKIFFKVIVFFLLYI